MSLVATDSHHYWPCRDRAAVVFMVMLEPSRAMIGSQCAASTLGAGRSRILWRVTLPLVSAVSRRLCDRFLHLSRIDGGDFVVRPEDHAAKADWDGILLQVNPIIATASVVVLIVVILMLSLSK